MTLLKTLLFTLVMPGTVAGLISYLLIVHGRALPPLPLGAGRLAGIVFLALGVIVYLWCAAEFIFIGGGTPSPTDPPRELVVTGPYRFSRNPMYVGVTAAILGTALWFRSAEVMLYASAVFIAFHLRIIHREEPVLERSFGASFKCYRERVPRWLPGIG